MRVWLTVVLLWAGSAGAQVDPWFAPDKALHFSLSAGLAGGGYGLTALHGEDPWVSFAFGAGLALAAGLGKELVDLAGPGQPSWKDLAWDVAGTAVGLLVGWLLERLIAPLVPRPSVSTRSWLCAGP